MAVWTRVLFTILVVFVKENASNEEEEPLTQACSTLQGARNVNEEVTKLFNTISIHELTKPYFELFVSLQHTNSYPIDQCYNRRGESFSDRFFVFVTQMSRSALNNEYVLSKALSLKENTTKIADLHKGAWMRIKKLYQLNEGIFDGLDAYLVDSMMEKTAKLIVDVKKTTPYPTLVEKIIDKLSYEFREANALMRMMPRQILNNPEKLQNNLVYSQLHTVLSSPTQKQLLHQNAAVAANVKVFSEISIKNNIKKATKILFSTYLKGHEDARKFSTMTKDTADRLIMAVDSADDMRVEVPCEEGKKIADKLVNEVVELLHNVRGEQEELIGDFYRDLRHWYDTAISSFEFLDQVRQAMSFLSPMVPQNVHPELDELHSYVTSRADKSELKKIEQRMGPNVYAWILQDGWYDPYDKLSKMLTKHVQVSECYRKVFQFVGKVVQSCSEGAGSLQDIYDDMSSQIPIDVSNCWDVSLFSRPSFDDITATVEKAARHSGFKKDCEQNTPQHDDAGNARRIVIDDYSDESEIDKLSRTQKFMVCNLRSKSMSDEKINKKMEIRDLDKVEAVRCKPNKSSRRADSMYARDNQV